MRTIKRYLASIGLLVVMALSLTACIHLDRNVSLNNDGSGTYVLTIGLNDQLLSLSGDQTTTMMNNFGDQVKQAGGSYRRYDDAGYTYWAYTRPFKSVTDLNNFLKQLPSSDNSSGGSSGSGGSLTSGSDTLSFSEQPGFLSNAFHVTGHISLKIPSSDTNSGGVDISPYLKDMRDSFAVTMPGSITAHKGGAVSGNTVTYIVHYGEETDIDVAASAPNTGTLIPIGAGIVILLLAIAGFIFWRFQSSRRKPVAAPAMYGGTGGQGPAPSWPANPSMSPYAPPGAPTPSYGQPPAPPSYGGPSSATPPPYAPPPSNTQSPWPNQ